MAGVFEGYMTDADVALGTIYGIRSFVVGPSGYLGPASISVGDYTYQDGENVASCTLHGNLHRPAYRYCSCGFYAYYDGSNDFYRAGAGGRVAGIIEAYGKCQVGTRGFRAEKAKIVALVIPEIADKIDHKHRPWCRPAEWLSQTIDREANFGVGGLISAFIGLALAGLGGLLGWPLMMWPGIALLWTGITTFQLSVHSFQYHRQDSKFVISRNLAKKYPSARIFKDEESMVAAFPLQRPKPPERFKRANPRLNWDKYNPTDKTFHEE